MIAKDRNSSNYDDLFRPVVLTFESICDQTWIIMLVPKRWNSTEFFVVKMGLMMGIKMGIMFMDGKE